MFLKCNRSSNLIKAVLYSINGCGWAFLSTHLYLLFDVGNKKGRPFCLPPHLLPYTIEHYRSEFILS